MKVWLLHVGEELPVDDQPRTFRYGYLAEALTKRGHEVLRWAPTFNHCAKKYRFQSDCRVAIKTGYAIQFVHSPAYYQNASWRRLHAYRVLARRFRELATREDRPDLIVAAIPSLEWAAAAVDLGMAWNIPVVIDVRDRWPDVYLNALPNTARPVGRFFLAPYYRLARHACRNATALTAVSQSYLDWALRLAARAGGPQDRVVPLGFEPVPVDPIVFRKNLATLEAIGIDRQQTICMYSGLFERSYDIETVVDAARYFDANKRNDLQFVLCGDGAKLTDIKRRSEGLRNLHLLGWTNAAMLQAVASIASIGLCPYSGDALQSLPNKPFEYMALRLAIVSSLSGELAELLDRFQCGVTYQAGETKQFIAWLTRILDAPDWLDRMRSNGHRAWQDNFRGRSLYDGFVHHLEMLTAKTIVAAA